MIESLGDMPTPVLLGIMFLIGLAADLIGRFTILPRVTLLLLGGLALGPVGFSLLPQAFLHTWFPALTNIALALVGFLLGQQISIKALRRRGAQIITISIIKVIGTWLVVAGGLFAIGVNPVVVLLMAAIASATAPTAIYDVVHEIRAKGEFVKTLLAVVAIDDVWGLILFIIMMAIAGMLNGDAGVAAGILAGSREIGGSVLLGIALGAPMAYLTGRIRKGEPMLAEGIGFVMLGAGAAEWFEVSPILTAMTMGAIVASLARHHKRPFHAIEGIEWPFMILFFVLAGASLETNGLKYAGVVAVAYVALRCVGIYLGARLGCQVTGADALTRKWLGLALFPQAGVAIGMALLASQRFPDVASIILSVVLTSTIFLEIFAPIVTRQALRATG